MKLLYDRLSIIYLLWWIYFRSNRSMFFNFYIGEGEMNMLYIYKGGVKIYCYIKVTFDATDATEVFVRCCKSNSIDLLILWWYGEDMMRMAKNGVWLIIGVSWFVSVDYVDLRVCGSWGIEMRDGFHDIEFLGDIFLGSWLIWLFLKILYKLLFVNVCFNILIMVLYAYYILFCLEDVLSWVMIGKI